jgi:hypothetical protein
MISKPYHLVHVVFRIFDLQKDLLSVLETSMLDWPTHPRWCKGVGPSEYFDVQRQGFNKWAFLRLKVLFRTSTHRINSFLGVRMPDSPVRY